MNDILLGEIFHALARFFLIFQRFTTVRGTAFGGGDHLDDAVKCNVCMFTTTITPPKRIAAGQADRGELLGQSRHGLIPLSQHLRMRIRSGACERGSRRSANRQVAKLERTPTWFGNANENRECP